MKHFRSVCNSFAILGIYPNPSHRKYPFNIKILMVFLCYSLTIISCCIYVFRNALSFEEYSDLIFRISLLCVIVAVYAVFVFKMNEFFHMLNTCEQIVDKSKSGHKQFSFDLLCGGCDAYSW